MSPQEKAKELVDKFARVDGYVDSIDLSKCEFEKKCALITVDEILNNFGTLTEGKQHYAAYSTIKFYEQVKQEIEKL